MKRCGVGGVLAAAAGLAALALLAGAASPPPARAAPQPACAARRGGEIDAASVLACLRRGERVVLTSFRIRKVLDLRRLGVVHPPFKCRGCRLEGVLAPDVIFSRTFDLSGSRIRQPANFEGATFLGPAVFGSRPVRTSFMRGANFSLAVFGDLAMFNEAAFTRRADFSLARFRSDAIFSGASFPRKVATFRGAVFAGDAAFDGTLFAGPATFRRASFGAVADFRQAEFRDTAFFTQTVFRQRADFSLAEFVKGAVFNGSQFTGAATFLDAIFKRGKKRLAASFVDVAAAGDLNFSFASFTSPQTITSQPTGTRQPEVRRAQRRPRPVRARPLIATFFGLTSGGTVSLKGARFAAGYAVVMNEISPSNLMMDVMAASLVDDGTADPTKPNQHHVLELIAASAKARGDPARANDAQYRLHVLGRERLSWFRKIFDDGYRYVLGYLLRPLNPLLALLVLATLFSLWRVLPAHWRRLRRFLRLHPLRRLRRLPRRVLRALRHPIRLFVVLFNRVVVRPINGLLDTLITVGPRSWNPAAATGWRRIEAMVYRVLLVCALIALAKSNPTLRELLDALL